MTLRLGEERFGEQAIYSPSGGMNGRRRRRIGAARSLLEVGESAIVATADGEKVFVESYAPRPNLYLFGASDHVAALVPLGKQLGYRVTVCDPRSVFLTRERFPDADELCDDWPDRFLARAPIDARTAICMMTHDLKFDVPALELALGLERRLHRRDRQREDPRRPQRPAARERGIGDAELARLHAPIGIPIGARTPDEVAVSIAAQLIEANVVARADAHRVDRPVDRPVLGSARRGVLGYPPMAARRIRAWPGATLLAALTLALLPTAPALAGPLGHSSTRAAALGAPAARRCRSGCAGRARRRAPARRDGRLSARARCRRGRRGRRRPLRSPWRSASARSSGCPACASSRWLGRRRRLAALARTADPRIRYVEPIVAAQAAHSPQRPADLRDRPGDRRALRVAVPAVGADQALNLAKGDPSMLVGVVDSGISAVPDLAGKIAETFWDKTVQPLGDDVIGHGTFVSSIIASRNDDGFGLAGFCGACRLAVYKASPLTDVQVAEGIRTLTDAHVRIINLSIVLEQPLAGGD